MSETPPTSDDDPLIALADRAIEGRLTRREVAELESLLDQGLPALQRYVQYIGLHAALHVLSDEEPLRRVPAALREADLAPARAASRRRRTATAVRRVGGVAAVLAVSAAAAWLLWRPTVASVREMSSQAAWSEPRGNDRIRVKDELRLASGFAELRFLNGVEVTLRGPALLRVESAEEIHLEYGQVFARVPPDAAGFAVRTPDGRLVDLGTEFLVTRGVGSRTSTTVRQGLVEAETAAGGTPRRVASNEAAAFDPGAKGWIGAAPDVDSLSAFALQALGFEVLSGNVLLIEGHDGELPAAHPSGRPGVVFVPELQAVRLDRPVDVIGPDGGRVVLPAGTIVNSYLLDGIGIRDGIWDAAVSLVSKKAVAGVIVSARGLRETDAGLGLPDVDYPTERNAGVEVDHPSGRDGVAVSPDLHRIDLKLSATGDEREQVRLVVPIGTEVAAGGSAGAAGR